jgi:cellulose synthase operon protein YhjQ
MPLLCLASPKGGVGKTTLAANLAWELARHGARVVALDLDPQNALRLHFGISLNDGAGLMPMLRRRGAWRGALRQTASGVLLLPYGIAGMATALVDAGMMAGATDMLTPILREILADPATILIVDTPPGPSAGLGTVLHLTDVLVTVLLADATSIALIPTVEQGRAYGPAFGNGIAARHGFVLNQVSPLSRLARATTEAVSRHLGERLLGTVSRDESVAEAIASQQSVFGFSPASRGAQDIARLARTIAARIVDVKPQAAPALMMHEPNRVGHTDRPW